MVIVKESTLSQALHRSRRKRATAHPAVALDTIPYLHCRHAHSSTLSDIDHVRWLVGVEAFSVSPWFLQAVSTLEQSKSGTGARRDLQASQSRCGACYEVDTIDLQP